MGKPRHRWNDHDKLMYAFCNQRISSRKRGIGWELTFEQWSTIWRDSGHLHERGVKKGQYAMARYKDKGPYSVNNVKIILHSDNAREQVANGSHNAWTKGRKLSLSTREKMSQARKSVTPELAEQIRNEFVHYSKTHGKSALADKYGVERHTIAAILRSDY